MDDEFNETCDISSDVEQDTTATEEDMTDTEIVEDDEFDETCDISSDIEQETAEIEEDMADTEIVEDDGDIHWTDDGVNYTVCQDACDEKDVEFLDENTSEEVSTEITEETEETEESIEEDVVWDDELRQLSDDDFGAVNEKVFDYDDPDYIKEGTLKVNYGPDTTGEKEAINVPQGTRFDQYTHSDTGGRYFAEEGADYDSLNLPDVEDKRTLSTYEVVEDGLEVDQSGIAFQPWQDKTGDNGSFQYNFPKMDEYGKRLYGEDGKPLYMSTEELLESGKIRKVEK